MNHPGIPYTLGFSIHEHPLEEGESLKVEYLTTQVCVTRVDADHYRLETDAPADVKRPGVNACSGIFADLAIAKHCSKSREEVPAWRASLSGEELDRCLAAISGMMVNTPEFHEESRLRDQTPQAMENEEPALVISAVEKGGKLSGFLRNLVGRNPN